MQKKNYVYIWAKYSLESKQNKAERAIFQEKLKTYLKAGEVAPEIFQVWFWDETGFSLRVIRRKVWRVEASTAELYVNAGHVEESGKQSQVNGAKVD